MRFLTRPRRVVYPFQIPGAVVTAATHTTGRPRDSFCVVTKEEQDEQSDAPTQAQPLAAGEVQRTGDAAERTDIELKLVNGSSSTAAARSSKEEWEL